ncbi:MAG: hypothetical protein ACKVLA_16455 [Rhodobacterales bacterium]
MPRTLYKRTLLPSSQLENPICQELFVQYAEQMGYSKSALCAAQEANARKHRHSHPVGKFGPDRVFRLIERCDCCANLRQADQERPHLEMLHGRTLTHVALLYDAPKLHVQRLAKALEETTRLRATVSESNKKQLHAKLRHILKPITRD